MSDLPTDDVWNLRARPDALLDAAGQWRALAVRVRQAADELNQSAAAAQGAWRGPAAETFDLHRGHVIGDLDEVAAQATAVGAAVETAAHTLRRSQQHLFDEWSRVAGVPSTVDFRLRVFSPATAADRDLVLDSVDQCLGVRRELRTQLGHEVAAIQAAQAKFRTVAATWLAVAEGSPEPFDRPPEPLGTTVIYGEREVLVNTGPFSDVVEIGVDPRTGLQRLVINGQPLYLPPDVAIVVRTGEGNDVVTVAPDTRLHVTLIGGDGNDVLRGDATGGAVLGLGGRDRLLAGAAGSWLSGGAGRDYLEGGAADDILLGGLGDDTLYGLRGDDQLAGGEGQDYLEGALGDDTLAGDAGNDVLSGGQGDDRLLAGAGNDVLYPGRGADKVSGGQGHDVVYGSAGDGVDEVEQTVTVQLTDAGQSIVVDGSPRFQARINADLDMLRSSPAGQQMLVALDAGHAHGSTVTIREYQNPLVPDNSSASVTGAHVFVDDNPYLDRFGINDGTTAVEGPPIVVLYHELAHAYDFLNGTAAPGTYTGVDNLGPYGAGVPNQEREAVGLGIDGDHDPTTPPQLWDMHPYALTENALRAELGVPRRTAY